MERLEQFVYMCGHVRACISFGTFVPPHNPLINNNRAGTFIFINKCVLFLFNDLAF